MEYEMWSLGRLILIASPRITCSGLFSVVYGVTRFSRLNGSSKSEFFSLKYFTSLSMLSKCGVEGDCAKIYFPSGFIWNVSLKLNSVPNLFRNSSGQFRNYLQSEQKLAFAHLIWVLVNKKIQIYRCSALSLEQCQQ